MKQHCIYSLQINSWFTPADKVEGVWDFKM